MNKNLAAEKIVALIHGLLTLMLPIGLALLFGCFKLPETGPSDLGPQASNEEVAAAFDKVASAIDPWTSRVGEQVVLTNNARVESQNSTIHTDDQTLTLLKREDLSSTKLRLTIHEYKKTVVDGKVTSGEYQQDVDRAETNRASVNSMTTADIARRLSPQKMLANDDQNEVVITYHNLHQESWVGDPPPLVKRKANCGGVPQCQMHYNLLGFDRAYWSPDSSYEVVRVEFITSPEPPHLAQLFEACLAGMTIFNGHRIFVRQCSIATDFSYDSAAPPN